MKQKNITFLIIITFQILLTCCVSTNKLRQTIDDKITGKVNNSELLNTDFMKLEIDSMLLIENEVTVKKKSSFFIPLIVYWTWKRTSECMLTNSYFVNLFNEVLIKKNKDFPYNNYFDNKKLILNLTTIPKEFYFTNKGTYIVMPQFLGVGIYFTSEDIYPKNQQIRVKYQFVSKNEIIKKGEEYVDFKNPVYSTLNPTYLGIEKYLDDMKIEFENQSNLLIDKVIDDL